MKKLRNKLVNTKYLAMISISMVLSSCRLLIDVFAYPVDRPGTAHDTHVFNQSFDSLQVKTDKFVLNSSYVVRYYSKYEYNDGKYRNYKMMCNTDTVYFGVVFVPKDTLSMLYIDFFRIQNVTFGTVDYKDKKKTIKRNKELYEKGLNCYKEVFLNPLIEYIEGDTIK